MTQIFNALTGLAAIGFLVVGTMAQAGDFSLRSDTIADGKTLGLSQVFNAFGCDGANQAPQLAWSDPPKGTKSFVVTAYDPDAPTGSGWWHWIVYNLPAGTRSLESGAALPEGAVSGRTDYGTVGFGGACPPKGDAPHRYIFTVTALGVDRLDLPADASAALVGYYTKAHALGSARITALYGR